MGCEECGREWSSGLPVFGVLCKQADGERIIVTVEGGSAEEALETVRAHQRIFYGPGDAAGRWLASRNPSTVVEVGEVRTLAEWAESEQIAAK